MPVYETNVTSNLHERTKVRAHLDSIRLLCTGTQPSSERLPLTVHENTYKHPQLDSVHRLGDFGTLSPK